MRGVPLDPRSGFDGLSSMVIGCGIAVHRELGPGFLEKCYRNAMVIALQAAGLECQIESRIDVMFRGSVIGVHQLDLVVCRALVIEVKAVPRLAEPHRAQLRSYLKASGIRVGLLLNYGRPTLEIARQVNNYVGSVPGIV